MRKAILHLPAPACCFRGVPQTEEEKAQYREYREEQRRLIAEEAAVFPKKRLNQKKELSEMTNAKIVKFPKKEPPETPDDELARQGEIRLRVRFVCLERMAAAAG